MTPDEKKLRAELEELEEDYFSQPQFIQEEDLETINDLRARLEMPLVDAQLKEIKAEEVEELPPEPEEVEEVDPHATARELYKEYLEKIEVLEKHRAYANMVIEATVGRGGRTPVYPLAKLGTSSGPLLCDHCKKPIPLEGGNYHGKTADVAWKENPGADKSWVSWILGGLVVEMQTNGTLRIYHGYPSQHNVCCTLAVKEDEKALLDFDSSGKFKHQKDLLSYLKEERPELDDEDRQELVDQILDTLYDYDPGLGVNRPS